tara:strand:- start:1231 stop:1431 length:201 start_codon:yes stop_codon:yes gene_type:complete
MVPASLPYALFCASNWNSAAAEPIGLRQSLRILPKKHFPKRATTQKKNVIISKKTLLKTNVQLAFA